MTLRRLRWMWLPVVLRLWPLARLWYRAWGLRLDANPEADVWYFAYGANMHDSAFRERRRMRPAEWRAGRIEKFRLCFNLEGRPKGKAAPANICADPGSEVWGVLYRITRRDLVRLNASEGVPGRRYRPIPKTRQRPQAQDHRQQHPSQPAQSHGVSQFLSRRRNAS